MAEATEDAAELTHAAPTSAAGVSECIVQAAATGQAVYPVAGGPALEGSAIDRSGVAVSMSGLSRVIDFPARDMTITLEAGVTMAALQETLSAEGLRLPLDVPHAESATIGGVVAYSPVTPSSSGSGTVRDYVIGIEAAGADGELFKGGGRVVKNVAGYDFCKLLSGSRGTLGVVTQVTLKLKPAAETTATLAVPVDALSEAETAFERLAGLPALPAAVELVAGPEWRETAQAEHLVVVRLEGSRPEVEWLLDEACKLLAPLPVDTNQALWDQAGDSLAKALSDWSGQRGGHWLQALSPAGSSCRMVEVLQRACPGCSVQAHAANGVMLAKPQGMPAADLQRVLVEELRPVARRVQGRVSLVEQPPGDRLAPGVAFDLGDSERRLMQAVKDAFDPQHRLNPGRFIFA
ncbi:MAG: FAD-binding oxidoreductase [Planctomycetota bacterium]